MLIRVYSDLHLDWYAQALHQTRGFDENKKDGDFDPFWYPPELPNDKETILILAGDLWEGSRWIEYAGISWIGKVAPRFKQVLIVLGNHDYWPDGDLTILNGADKCNAMLQDRCLFNVHVLDMNTFEIDDTLFVGATLWTDMFNRNPLAMYNMPQFMSYDSKCIYETKLNGELLRFTSERWVQTHIKHKAYIRHVASQNKDKDVIVMTHHMPLLQMIDNMYKGRHSNAYYASDLSDVILDNKNIKFWICGHSHVQKDEMFEHCRLYMNSVGYQGEHFEQQGLVKHETIEI